jgi:hypothetical protein
VFKTICVFDKTNYTSNHRKEAFSIGDSVESTNGFYRDKVLYLPEESKKIVDSRDIQLIIIVDSLLSSSEFNTNSKTETYPNTIALGGSIKPRSFEIFNIKRSSKDVFELFLNYDRNEFAIGIPKRKNHKIAELKPGIFLRYLVNGKSDFTMTGRKQRTYYEYEYIFEDLKSVKHVEFIDDKELIFLKEIKKNNCKLIDERKLLR